MIGGMSEIEILHKQDLARREAALAEQTQTYSEMSKFISFEANTPDDDEISDADMTEAGAELHRFGRKLDEMETFGRPILDQIDLHEEAAELRRMLAGESDVCNCLLQIDDECTCETAPIEAPRMDVRERKWAAAKLLRPIETDHDDLLADMDDEEMLVMYAEYWKLVAPSFGKTPGETSRHMALQYRQTRKFACQAWGIKTPSWRDVPKPIHKA